MVCFSCLTCYKNQTKNISFDLTVQESVYCSKSNMNLSVHSLPKYFVSVISTLIYRHSIRLNNIPYDIKLICVTYFQMYHYLMQCYNKTMGCQKASKKVGL